MYSCSVKPAGDERWMRLRRLGGAVAVAHRAGALELDLVAAVHDTVEDRIGQRGVAQVGVLGLDRQLAGDQGRARADAVVEQFEQVVALGRADG